MDPTARVLAMPTGMSEGRWTETEPSPHPHEREALDFVRRRLANSDPWRSWSNFTFVGGPLGVGASTSVVGQRWTAMGWTKTVVDLFWILDSPVDRKSADSLDTSTELSDRGRRGSLEVNQLQRDLTGDTSVGSSGDVKPRSPRVGTDVDHSCVTRDQRSELARAPGVALRQERHPVARETQLLAEHQHPLGSCVVHASSSRRCCATGVQPILRQGVSRWHSRLVRACSDRSRCTAVPSVGERTDAELRLSRYRQALY